GKRRKAPSPPAIHRCSSRYCAIVALIAIKTFLQLIKRISFIPFAIYRFIVAAAVYVVFF
ncbi:hypothetical protein ACUOFC_54460, partial [Escherichia sp. TWPC-MK]